MAKLTTVVVDPLDTETRRFGAGAVRHAQMPFIAMPANVAAVQALPLASLAHVDGKSPRYFMNKAAVSRVVAGLLLDAGAHNETFSMTVQPGERFEERFLCFFSDQGNTCVAGDIVGFI